MQAINLDSVGLFVAYLVALITGVKYLKKTLGEWIDKALKPVNESIKEVDMNACKNYLVSFLSDVEKDKTIDEIEKERFWEQYEHYQKIGGNSYITRKVEALKNEGKL